LIVFNTTVLLQLPLMALYNRYASPVTECHMKRKRLKA